MKNKALFFLGVFCVVGSLPLAQAQQDSLGKKWSFQIGGGLSLPVGDFGSTSSANAGGAKTGFTFNADLGRVLGGGFAWWTSLIYSRNSLNDEFVQTLTGTSSFSGDLGSWTTIWPMTGVRYFGTTSPTIGIYGIGQIGLLLGSTPEVSVTSGGSRVTSKSKSSSALAFGFGGGLIIKNRFNVGIRYITAQPQYDLQQTVTISLPGFQSTQTITGKADAPTSLFQLVVGIVF